MHGPSESLSAPTSDGSGGEGGADAAELLPALYAELRDVAERYMRKERSEHTLQPTALVHEAWLRLAGGRETSWRGRSHFLGAAAHSMRTILVDPARRRRAEKRGGRLERVALDEAVAFYEQRGADLLDLDAGLDRLSRIDDELRSLVELRFFGGLTNAEIGVVLGLSTPTVERRWRVARAWLRTAVLERDADGR